MGFCCCVVLVGYRVWRTCSWGCSSGSQTFWFPPGSRENGEFFFLFFFLLHWKKRFDGASWFAPALHPGGGSFCSGRGWKGILASGGHGDPPAPKIASSLRSLKQLSFTKNSIFPSLPSLPFPPEEKWRAFSEIITFLTAY